MNLDKPLNAVTALFYLVLITAWVTGVALVKGFWLTLICFIAPPISWVVVAQFTLTHLGLI